MMCARGSNSTPRVSTELCDLPCGGRRVAANFVMTAPEIPEIHANIRRQFYLQKVDVEIARLYGGFAGRQQQTPLQGKRRR